MAEKARRRAGGRRRARRSLPWRGDDPVRDASFWADHYLGYLSARARLGVGRAARWSPNAEGAVVVHCAAGKDRTGTVVAMALDVAGVPHDEIVADYVLTGERIEQIIGRLLPRDRPTARRWPSRSSPSSCRRRSRSSAILAAVDEGWGGAAGWLRRPRAGATADVERLRRRLTEPASR